MSRGRAAGWALLAALLLTVASAPARAQYDSTAFSVERFVPSPGAHSLLATDEADVLEHLELSFGAVASLMTRPLVLQRVDAAGEQVSAPVERRLGIDLLAALGLGARYQLGVGLPLVLGQRGDRLAGIGLDERPLAAYALGDLRLHAKLRVGELTPRGLATAVALTWTLPTGDQDHFAGEAGQVLAVGLIGGWRARQWRVAINLGARFRSEQVVLLAPSRPHSNELLASVAGALVVPRIADGRLELIAEAAKVFGDCREKTGGECVVRGYSPAELRVGARGRVADRWTVELGFGVGTTPDEVGSPDWRAVVGVRGVLARRTSPSGRARSSASAPSSAESPRP